MKKLARGARRGLLFGKGEGMRLMPQGTSLAQQAGNFASQGTLHLAVQVTSLALRAGVKFPAAGPRQGVACYEDRSEERNEELAVARDEEWALPIVKNALAGVTG